MTSVEDRLWSRIEKSDGCWLWTGTLNRQGYGVMSVGGRAGGMRLVHRIVYHNLVGDVPDGMVLDHRHDCSKNCVNPHHLRVVTRRQNNENFSGPRKDSQSGIRGVSWHKKAQKWRACVSFNGKQHHLGLFLHIEDAEAAALAKRRELFTHNDMDRTA